MTNTLNTIATYVVAPLTASSVAGEGEQLLVVNFKSSEGKKAAPSVCVSVPKIELMVEPECLAKPLQQAFNKMRVEAVRKYMLQEIAGNTGANMVGMHIPANVVTAEDIATEQNSNGIGRLNKEMLQAWFDVAMKDNLQAAVLVKFPDATSVQLDKIANDYKDKVAKIAAPRMALTLDDMEKLASKLKECAHADELRDALIAKLQAAMTKPVVEDGLLDF